MTSRGWYVVVITLLVMVASGFVALAHVNLSTPVRYPPALLTIILMGTAVFLIGALPRHHPSERTHRRMQPMADGQWITHGNPAARHACELPRQPNVGAIWQCSCGKRWRCWSIRMEHIGNGYVCGPHWCRYRMPWNRKSNLTN
jgi:hypothetical protein